MVRAGSSTPSKKKEKEGAALSAEDKAEEAESKRLRDIAFSRRLLSRSRSHAHHPSFPSKTILNADGRDIVKKGHRKSKYLFAFPGLLSPVAGGKLGELTNLDSRNPVLYVEFPQGRLKMFGTIVYPKNKYLTLHFPRGGGNIACEDCFESIIVFSQAWWIGTKEQNPEEARLPLPKALEQEKNAEVDFTAGAGQTKDFNKNRHQLEKSEIKYPTPSMEKPEISESESTGKDSDAQVVIQSVRQSARTAGRKLKYADSSSDSGDSNSDESQHILSTRGKKQADKVDTNTGESSGVKAGTIFDIDDITPKKRTPGSVKAAEKGIADLKPVAVTAKTPLKATNSKSSVLKQSRIESFCHVDPALQEATATMADIGTTVDSKDEVITSAVKANIKSTKRPRKASEDTAGSDSDIGNDESHVVKGTPKRWKQAKSEQDIETTKVSTPKGKNTSSSKVQQRGKNERAKQQKIIKERKAASGTSAANASIPRGRQVASGSRKPSKESFDTEDEDSDMEDQDSDTDDGNDDSDEDYVG